MSANPDNPTRRINHLQRTEEDRLNTVLEWVTYAALIFLIGIGTKSLLANHLRHGFVLYGFCGLFAINLVWFNYHKEGWKFRAGLLGSVALLFVYLTASGGESNTGPLWFYVFPPLVFFLVGLKAGLLLMCISLAFIALIFSFPDLPLVIATYGLDFKIRFLSTMFFVSVFCYVLDHSRRAALSELVSMVELYERVAKTDELTGLPNRRDMRAHLEKEFSRFTRNGHHFSVILLDIDHFKRINDNYGHDAGDLVLKEFGTLVKNFCRLSDIPSRWGGEEFLVLLPDTTLVQALALAERLRVAVEHHVFPYRDQTIPVTLSAGICSITQYGSIESLLKQTDVNLYEAKEKGRNQVVPRVRQTAPSPEVPSANA